MGPCQPGLREEFQFPVDGLGRKFQISWHTKSFGKGSLEEERNWFVYSPTNGKMYSHTCWLFSDSKAENYSEEWAEPNSGVCKWKKGVEKLLNMSLLFSIKIQHANICIQNIAFQMIKLYYLV